MTLELGWSANFFKVERGANVNFMQQFLKYFKEQTLFSLFASIVYTRLLVDCLSQE